jgi:putative hydrolase of the HAD superfamily
MNNPLAAIFLDLGDTIMDEDTEVKDASGTTLSADLLPGMAEALRQLKIEGHRLALVADSRPNTPPNVLKQHGLIDLFDFLAVSENLGSTKPDEGIFRAALEQLDIPERDYGRVMMVGNNLERDIVGANRMGLIPVFFHANDHRPTQPTCQEETPHYTVSNAKELHALVSYLSITPEGSRLPQQKGSREELDRAARHTPNILFDAAEPFLPIAVGYTIFNREEQSPSFSRRIQHAWRPDWHTAIEYAIWWDWDIGHLYELEHVWSYLDAADELVFAEGSSHGGYASNLLENGAIPQENGHPLVYSQPGKHAFSPTPHWFDIFRDSVAEETTVRAGIDGVLVKDMYKKQIPKNAVIDGRVARYLKGKAFEPTRQFTQAFHIPRAMLTPWPVLDQWIPARVNWWIGQLASLDHPEEATPHA